MATFANTTNATPFGAFDADSEFKTEADQMVVFVKRKMGDDVLSVELTKKQIFANMEEASLEYSSILNQYQAKSQLVNFLGYSTGSMSGSQERYVRDFFDVLNETRTELKDEAGAAIFDNTRGKLKIAEVFHFNPQAAYRFFDTTSAINYLNNEFSFESFTPETIFYVLPVFEDILRAGQLDLSNRVRRSNYSYEVNGTKIRIFPTPTQGSQKKLWIRVRQYPDPMSPSYKDETIHGVSNMSNIPFGNLTYSRINSIGKQWIRQYTLSLSREQLGLIRSKFGNIPIPGGDVTLNGDNLVSQGREDQTNLKTQLKEMLETMTYDKLIEIQSTRAEQMNKQLRYVPMPLGKAIIMG